MQNSIYKIKFFFSVLGLGGVVFDCLGGWANTPPERNTA